MQLICSFVFAYAKSRFSHDEAHITNLPTTDYTCVTVPKLENPPAIDYGQLRRLCSIDGLKDVE